MTHDEMIAVIAHHKNGGKVQWQLVSASKAEWRDCYNDTFAWDFNQYNYRAKPEPKSLDVIWDETHDQILTYVGTSEKPESLMAICSAKLPDLRLTLKKFVEVNDEI